MNGWTWRLHLAKDTLKRSHNVLYTYSLNSVLIRNAVYGIASCPEIM